MFAIPNCGLEKVFFFGLAYYKRSLPLRFCVLSSCNSLMLLGSKSLRFHFSHEEGGGLVPIEKKALLLTLLN